MSIFSKVFLLCLMLMSLSACGGGGGGGSDDDKDPPVSNPDEGQGGSPPAQVQWDEGSWGELNWQ